MSDPIEVLPADSYNAELVANVHPSDWKNPQPQPRYHLVIIGAGTAGLVAAIGAAGLGAKVALIERNLMGGDCLNVGCVPSKALIRSSRVAAQIRRAAEFGVNVSGEVTVDFPAVMQRMRRLRAEISPHDSAARFRDNGVDVFLGQGAFTSSDKIEVDGQTLNFKKAVIATGGRAVMPPIPGLDDVAYLTNETLFTLTELPRRLAVIGGGPIGCEMVQAFARFGSHVTLLESNSHVLHREDAEAAAIVQQALVADGVDLHVDCHIDSVRDNGTDKSITFIAGGAARQIDCDAILVSAGRQPNVEGLGLEAAGVEYDKKTGVVVDDKLRTTNHNVFAAGDICFPYKFTHTADAMARIVIQNALFKGRAKTSSLNIPWCTFTDPEIAHVGLSEYQAQEKGFEVDTFKQELSGVDRAILDGGTDGFIKIHLRRGTDKIIGATIVASHAGDMISQITTAMTGNVGLGKIAKTIHPYPTQAEAIKRTADAYNRTRLTPLVKKLFEKWLSWTL
ncbi:Mercuric reductase [Symmachiella macrocystis]|uniref:Mercuric reductase n=1 Tax=Symmachiella macrocystis TaxID=2527985 RepID=A0A5C6BQD3_9PLAN|nr:mercuric reductase [Symmachiella macrocystis]TWU14413.1 Mercuric reductase [Symmachiella macrocystis]